MRRLKHHCKRLITFSTTPEFLFRDQGGRRFKSSLPDQLSLANSITYGMFSAISVLAPDGTALYVNPMALENVGATLEEVKRKGHLGLTCHPDDLDRVLNNRRIGLSNGVLFELEMRLLKDGEYRWNLV